MKQRSRKNLEISDEAYSDIRKFRFELNRDSKKWLKFYKNHPLIKTCLKLLDKYDKELQARYTVDKESYWERV